MTFEYVSFTTGPGQFTILGIQVIQSQLDLSADRYFMMSTNLAPNYLHYTVTMSKLYTRRYRRLDLDSIGYRPWNLVFLLKHVLCTGYVT